MTDHPHMHKSFYDRHILPRALNVLMGLNPIQKQRAKVVPRASGRVLEIGIGAGHNLSFYDPSKVEKVWGLEPDPFIRKRAAARAVNLPFAFEFIDLPGEQIPLDDKSVDTVLVTYTMCTIPGVEQALENMRRVLKPGGKLIFCEHGKSPEAGIEKWQHRVEPVWKKLAGGCHLTRNPLQLLENTGYRIDSVETMYLPSTPKVAGYNYWGTASLK